MAFGQIIKKLRNEANMTQETLAELLNISPQAVSRWETNLTMPDISLLPPLANLFQVTTDYLLEMDTYQKDLRKTEFEEAFYEYWKKDDKEKNYNIAIAATTEYPNNMAYMEWLASAEFYIALPNSDNTEYTRLLESSVKHYRIVLNHCKNDALYHQALHGIVLALHWLGKLSDAKDYAMLETDVEKQNELLCWCLEGEEKIQHTQKMTEVSLNHFITQLQHSSKSLEKCIVMEEIIKLLFPDGNYQYYHNFLQYNAIDKAILLCKEEYYDDAIYELKKAKTHAEAMVQYNTQTHYRFTAPLFCYVKGEKEKNESNTTDIDDFISSLHNSCFDPIRDRMDFKILLESSTSSYFD